MNDERDWGLLIRPTETMVIVLLLLLVPHIYTVYLIAICLISGGAGSCLGSLTGVRAVPFLVTAGASYIVAGAVGNVLWPRYARS